jgi:hypothetical protein
MKTTITLIIGLAAGLLIGWFAGLHRHTNVTNLQADPRTLPIEVQAKQVAERTQRSAKLAALLSLLNLEEQNLKALAVTMNIPDDVSKMEATKALDDPTMKPYSVYFQFKGIYEAMLKSVQEMQPDA